MKKRKKEKIYIKREKENKMKSLEKLESKSVQ